MTTDPMESNAQQQTPEAAAAAVALSEEDRRKLENEVQQLKSKLDTVKEDIRAINLLLPRMAAIDEAIAAARKMIVAAEECLCTSTSKAFTATLQKYPLLQMKTKGVIAQERKKTIEDYCIKEVDLCEKLQAESSNVRARLFAATDKRDILEEALAQKTKLLESAENSGGDEAETSTHSGLEYYEREKQVKFKLDEMERILMNGGKILDNVPILENFHVLDEAWTLFNGNDNAAILGNMDTFIDNLNLKVDLLHHTFLKIGWHPLTFAFDFGESSVRDKGEMLFQQLIYLPYASLFFAAANVEGWSNARYKADQTATASLSYLSYESTRHRNPLCKKLAIRPDSAVTLGRNGWDVIGMMELKKDGPDPDSDDTMRCVLMTAITARVLNQDLPANEREKIAIPFVLGAGLSCSLFVTTLDGQGVPQIKVVKFPGTNTLSRNIDVSNFSSIERKYLFVALAVLLNNMKTLCADGTTNYGTYNDALAVRRTLLDNITNSSKPPSKAGNGNGQGSRGSRGRRGTRQSTLSDHDAIQEAQAAACLGGIFTNVEQAFKSFGAITSSLASHETTSYKPPLATFYFKGRVGSSDITSMTTDVFLKVWNEDVVGVQAVEAEWTRYQDALDAGVPVAAPVLPEIVRTTGPSGYNHLVLAVEYIDEDPIQSMSDVVRFSESLIQNVIQMHDEANLLHCDLKPSNLRWRNGVVHLIDFGRAQRINLAVWVPGTRGYEAPEIVDRMPCSVMTDAFSVGQTIMEKLEEVRAGSRDDTSAANRTFSMLLDVAKGLSDPNVDSRWSLEKALWEIDNKILTFPKDNSMEPSPPITVKKALHSLPLALPQDMSKPWNDMLSQNGKETGEKIAQSAGSDLAYDAAAPADMDSEVPSCIMDEGGEDQNSNNLSVARQRSQSNKDCNLPWNDESMRSQGKKRAAPTIDQ